MNPLETTTFTLEGFTFRASLVHHGDVRPDRAEDFDPAVFSQEEIDAWYRDEWTFVTAYVTPIINGVEIEAACTNSGEYTYGYLPGRSGLWDLARILEEAEAEYAPEWLKNLEEAVPALKEALDAASTKLAARRR